MAKLGGKLAAKGAAKVAAKAAMKGGAKLAMRAGAGALKAIPGLGIAATVGMAAFDAYDGWKNAGEITGKADKDLTTRDKAEAATASALSGLTFGLVSSKTMYKGVNAVTSGVGKAWNWLTGSRKDKNGKEQGSRLGNLAKPMVKWSPLGIAARAGKAALGGLKTLGKGALDLKKISLLTKMADWVVSIGKGVIGIAKKMGVKVKAPEQQKGATSLLGKVGKVAWNIAKWTPHGMAIRAGMWAGKKLFKAGKKGAQKLGLIKKKPITKKPIVKKPLTSLDYLKIIAKAVLGIAKQLGVKIKTRAKTIGKKMVGKKGTKKKTSFLGKVGKVAWNIAKWTPHGMAIRAGMWAGKKLIGAGKKGAQKQGKKLPAKIKKPVSLLDFIKLIAKNVSAIAKAMGVKLNIKKKKLAGKITNKKGTKKKTSFLGKVGKVAWNIAKWTPHGMAIRAGIWAGKKLYNVGKKGAQKLGIIKKKPVGKQLIKKGKKPTKVKKPTTILDHMKLITKAVLSIAKLMGAKINAKRKALTKGIKKKGSLLGKVGKFAWNVAKWTPAGMAVRAGMWAGKKLIGGGKKPTEKGQISPSIKTPTKSVTTPKKKGLFGKIGGILSKGPFGIIKGIISRVKNLVTFIRSIARSIIGIDKKLGVMLQKNKKKVPAKKVKQNGKKIINTKTKNIKPLNKSKVPVAEAKTTKPGSPGTDVKPAPAKKLAASDIKSKKTGVSVGAQHANNMAKNAQKAKSGTKLIITQKSSGEGNKLDLNGSFAKLPMLIAKGMVLYDSLNPLKNGNIFGKDDEAAKKYMDQKMGALESLQDSGE